MCMQDETSVVLVDHVGFLESQNLPHLNKICTFDGCVSESCLSVMKFHKVFFELLDSWRK